MKAILLLIVCFTVAGCGPSAAENKQADADLQKAIAETNARLQRELLDSKVQYVNVKFGPLEAKKYRLCSEFPPETKRHQDECKALFAKVDEAQKRQEKW